ncbi:MAG: S4 domain-containing protein YaaA [Streptococcaceae bacterium]|jgi:ribosome-associated protein YbcJ (S4-like RNA binding protein)|nr:S4 domain-containing protein YaaA [Streptococcaceae bacterium]
MDYPIYDDYIKLGDLLKNLDVISSGGQAKYYLPEHPVVIDGEAEIRRGRKIYPGMTLKIETLLLTTRQPTDEELMKRSAEIQEKQRVKAMVKQMNTKNFSAKKNKKTRNKSEQSPRFPGR